MNVSSPAVREKRRCQYQWTPELDAFLHKGYAEGLALRQSAINHIVAITGWTRQTCWDRARKLGLTSRRTQRLRRWSRSEDRLLASLLGTRNIRLIARRLNRSVAAVKTRVRFLKAATVRVQEGFTKTELGEMVGRSPRTVQSWIEKGWLIARIDGQRGSGCTIRVSEQDLLGFWQHHSEEIPFYMWKRECLEWFLTLLSEHLTVLTSSPSVLKVDAFIHGIGSEATNCSSPQ